MSEISFPLTINGIEWGKTGVLRPAALFGATKCGDFVAVRPCDPEHKGHTFLGVFLGEIALSIIARMREGDVMAIDHAMYNPAIFVPDLGKVVFGCESWWGRIRSEADLRQITDADIEGTWYVQALKQIEVAQA